MYLFSNLEIKNDDLIFTYSPTDPNEYLVSIKVYYKPYVNLNKIIQICLFFFETKSSES